MSVSKLSGLKVAILVADGFEEVELTEPKKALENVGAKVYIISPSKSKVKSWSYCKWSSNYLVDVSLEQAKSEDYQALLLPGGVINPDHLRIIPYAVDFVKKFVDQGKPIAAICHGPWTLINAGGVKGKTITSWSSLKMDLTNAGAKWVDKEVVRDGNLVTSRMPGDLPAFNNAMIELFYEALRK